MPTRHHRLSSILAAKIGQRQVESVILADRAAAAVDRAISSVWRQLLAVLAGPRDWAQSYHAALRVLGRLTPAVAAELGARLHGLAEQGHKSAAKLLADALPLEYLRAAALTTPTTESRHGPTKAPARLARPGGGILGDDGAGVHFQAADGLVALSEGEADDLARVVRTGRLASAGLPDPPRGDVLFSHLLPGVGGVELHAQPAQLNEDEADAPFEFTWRGGEPLHEPQETPNPVVGPEPALPLRTVEAPRTVEHWRELFRALLFPPPPLELLQQIVFAPTAGQAWTERISSLSRLAPPEVLASIVANGMAAGKMQRDIAAEILPQVNGVRSSAARIARTEGIRVLNTLQERAHDQLGDLVLGGQVHAVLDANTRSWHAARSGTVYYRDPKPGQKGPEQQPHPPQEAADASERPAGTPQTASNCRCYTSPVLRPPEHIVNSPEKMAVFTTNAGKVVPDVASYSTWFERADDRRRRIAVGSRRYDWAKQEFGPDVGWETFVGPKGNLIPLKALKAESDLARGKRIAKVRDLMARRAELIRQTSTFGFLAPAA